MKADSETHASVHLITEAMTGRDVREHEIIELLFFAYRDFISDPDAILSESGFGRAHHRAVYFINRDPGMTVATLLETLQITKQSLARVLKELIDSGYIEQLAGEQDRRQRRLYPTQAGRALALALAAPQSRRIARALAQTTPQARAHVIEFLAGMATASARKSESIFGKPDAPVQELERPLCAQMGAQRFNGGRNE